jgi:hypothetical protein
LLLGELDDITNVLGCVWHAGQGWSVLDRPPMIDELEVLVCLGTSVTLGEIVTLFNVPEHKEPVLDPSIWERASQRVHGFEMGC